MPRVVGTLPFRMPFTHRKGEGALVGDPQMCSLELSQRHLAPRAWNCPASSHLGWTGVLECKGHAKCVTCLKSRCVFPAAQCWGLSSSAPACPPCVVPLHRVRPRMHTCAHTGLEGSAPSSPAAQRQGVKAAPVGWRHGQAEGSTRRATHAAALVGGGLLADASAACFCRSLMRHREHEEEVLKTVSGEMSPSRGPSARTWPTWGSVAAG